MAATAVHRASDLQSCLHCSGITTIARRRRRRTRTRRRRRRRNN